MAKKEGTLGEHVQTIQVQLHRSAHRCSRRCTRTQRGSIDSVYALDPNEPLYVTQRVPRAACPPNLKHGPCPNINLAASFMLSYSTRAPEPLLHIADCDELSFWSMAAPSSPRNSDRAHGELNGARAVNAKML